MSEDNTQAPDPAATPPLDESIRQVGAAGRAAADSAKHTLRSLRRLASADFALARSAFGRALAWAGVAIVFGASAWLLMAATLIALLQSWGLSWLQALLITSLLSLAVTGYAIWRVSYFFHHTGMHATRRQLSRLGLFDEPSKLDINLSSRRFRLRPEVIIQLTRAHHQHTHSTAQLACDTCRDLQHKVRIFGGDESRAEHKIMDSRRPDHALISIVVRAQM